MKRKIWSFFCALFLAMQTTAQADVWEPAEELSLYATAAVLLDADTGRVLYGKNADTPMAMASTTKIMTCILVLENTDPDEELTVSGYAAGMPKVKLYIKQGERYRVRDLLYSLMLESHNDSAVALAEHVGKRLLERELADKPSDRYTAEESGRAVAAFARMMNEKAVGLGCRDSWFITPNGLDATQEFTLQDGTVIRKDHCTTAAELARIMAYCIGESPEREAFLEITGTHEYAFGANGRSFSCVNHNAFLSMMEGALSGKTGFTNKAGYCYVGALKRDGRTFVVALLACGWPNHKSYKWSDTRELMEYGIDNYFYRSFLEEGTAFDEDLLQPLPVAGGQTTRLGATAYVEIELAGRADRETPKSGESPGAGRGAGEAGDFGGEREPFLEGMLLRADEKTEVETGRERAGAGEAGDFDGERELFLDDMLLRADEKIEVETGRERAGEGEAGGFDGERELFLDGMLLRADEKIEVEYRLERALDAPVEAGAAVGEVLYSVDGVVYRRERIVTASEVRRIDLFWCMEQVWMRFLP